VILMREINYFFVLENSRKEEETPNGCSPFPSLFPISLHDVGMVVLETARKRI